MTRTITVDDRHLQRLHDLLLACDPVDETSRLEVAQAYGIVFLVCQQNGIEIGIDAMLRRAEVAYAGV